MDLTLKIGNQYICRNGDIAIITKHIKNIFPREVYQVGGKILNKDGTLKRIAYWTVSGIYSLDGESEFDLIKKI